MSDKEQFYDTTWLILADLESHIRAVEDRISADQYRLKYLTDHYQRLLDITRRGEKEDSRGL